MKKFGIVLTIAAAALLVGGFGAAVMAGPQTGGGNQCNRDSDFHKALPPYQSAAGSVNAIYSPE